MEEDGRLKDYFLIPMVNNSESHSTQLLKESPVGSRSTGPLWELVDNTHWFFFDFPILLYQLFYSCFLGLTVPNYFYFVTGSVFFFDGKQAKTTKLTYYRTVGEEA